MKLSDQKRLDILQAAEQLFYQQGLEQTSMDQVAQLANVSKRTVYNHFDTKDALFQAILDRMREQLGSTAAVQFDANQAIQPQLLHIAQQEAQLLISDTFLRTARVAFLHMLKQPELAKRFSGSKVGCMSFLETFLQQAVQANALKIDDVELAAKQFVMQLKSFLFYPRLYGFDEPDARQQQHIIEETVSMFLARYQVTA
ncbi:TetR/AcrR family transcriptional regulator [Bowmanella denitrificans]|uniref:TetR/AcrR family transcriptional regulator n=1 Tax=Bowmanella denitrificans TaxID=366582 RepID=UPI000C9B359F|nr:TetR/AcrR family transcriptional regulator [Bowmanella denitrificans]